MKKLIVFVVVFSMFLVACGKKMDERTSYIRARVDSQCEFLKAGNILDVEAQKRASEVFKSYGFDPENKTALADLDDIYSVDQDAQKQIKEGIQKCADRYAPMDSIDVDELINSSTQE